MDQNPFMMAGGMPPQGMQRPQPGNENDQIHAKIMEELRKMTIPQGGWQMTLDMRERANWIMQLYVSQGYTGAYRHSSPAAQSADY